MWQETELFQRSYEDVSIAFGILWMELELFNAGLTSGSLVLDQSASQSTNSRARERPMQNFELHYFVALYRAQLEGSRLTKSQSTIEYIENCGQLNNDLSLVHDMPLLVLAVSAVKLPHTSNPIDDVYLQVEGGGAVDELNHPYEMVSLAHIRDALGYDVGVASDFIARFLISHFIRLGLVFRVDAAGEPALDDSDPMEVLCTFPSTLAIDASTSVESLFASIQACLEDIDLSVNEFGLLLLVRRCWPTGMMTDYALTRLTSMVLAWILTEEHRMLDVVRDFVSINVPMPGVRSVGEKPAWPEPIYNLAAREGSIGGAAEYTTTRRKITTRFALPWLLQVHDLNRSLYVDCLYQQCLQVAEASLFTSKTFITQEERQADYEIEMADETLKYIVKLCQLGVVWTTFDDLFVNWLDTMSKLSHLESPVVFKHLPRLFSNDDLSGGRRSMTDDNANEEISQYMVDPWRVVVDAVSDDMAGLERCLQWVLVLARSGVEIPNSTLMQLSAFARDMNASFFTHSILIEALLYSVRRSNVPVEPKSTDALSIDIDMLDLLSFAATEGTPETCVIAAKFLSTLVSESSLLGVDEVDQFVVINGHALCKCAWHFYSLIDIPELNLVRLKLLLRLLIVDVQPFMNILEEALLDTSLWESRFEVITRLFRVVLDINTPGLEIPGHQWRPSIVPVVVTFFSQLWKDNRVEIRLACDTLIKTLLPSHMDSISLCFEEYLFHAALAERVSFVGFLTLLHPVLPSWQLISWKTIAQVLREDGIDIRAVAQAETQDALVPNSENETTTLQASLVNLALQMVADGSVANLHSLLQVKLRLVRLVGFQKCHEIKGRSINRIDFDSLGPISQNTVVQLCFQGLMRALDTSVSCDLPPACMVDKADEGMVKGHLGSVFADVLIKIVHQIDFSAAPYLVSRSLLTSLVIILTKHDFSSPLLSSWTQHLYGAVYSVMQLLLKPNISFDIKQMIFSVGQAAIKQLQEGDKKAATSIFHEYISVTTSVVFEHGVSSDHMLAVRGREFFEDILIQWAPTLPSLFPCSTEFFAVLGQVLRDRIKTNPDGSANQQGENMRDVVVREILSMTLERKMPEEVNAPLKNLAAYVEIVHHTGYPDSLIQLLGSTMASIATQIAEWRPSTFDPNHLIKICSLVAQHHKAQSQDLLLQCEKYLRVALHRFHVDQASISQLLQVSVTSHRRLSRMPGAIITVNCIPDALLDTANHLLKGRLRQQAQTLTNLLETVCQSLAMGEAMFATESVLSTASEGLAYLQEYRMEGSYTDFDFTANLGIAKLMMQAINIDSRAMIMITGPENGVSIRIWAHLLQVVIASFWSESGVVLWRILGKFSQEYNRTLQRILAVPQNMTSDMASIDINLATISVKLWLLLIQEIGNKSAIGMIVGHNMDRDQCERLLWNEIWPGFERLLQRSIAVSEFEEFQASGNLIVQSFVDLIHLLRHLQSSLLLDSKIPIYLDQIKALKHNDSMSNKIARAAEVLRGMTSESSSTDPMKSIRRDFLAVEKIGWEVRRRAEEREARRHAREPTMG
ncbi:hypothetical protein FRC17_005740 [Serendipita sp. 399]|nr:hypothetical protein FRC17_005740 [Serendipita sp. 399]